MGALLSQAIANQLRQVPGFQNPRPTPGTLLQQVLNPPGPSRPMWMAGPMENQQLLAQNTPEANRAAAQNALRMAMAFGGADITKEERAAWEAENEAARRHVMRGGGAEAGAFPPGTRVGVRPSARAHPEDWRVLGEDVHRPDYGTPYHEGTIVTPGTPEAGEPGIGVWRDPIAPPSPDHVAVRREGSNYWSWRHRNDLEVLRPLEEFPEGSEVEYKTPSGAIEYRGTVTQPPKGHAPSPGSDYVWVDVHSGTPRMGMAGDPINVRKYSGGDTFGAYFHRKDLVKKGK